MADKTPKPRWKAIQGQQTAAGYSDDIRWNEIGKVNIDWINDVPKVPMTSKAPRSTEVAAIKSPYTKAGSAMRQVFSDKNAASAKKGIDNVTPYMSNAVNALRKPPKPARGTMLNSVTLGKVNLDQERTAIDRDIRGANLHADRAVDSQTAAAIRGANAAKGAEARGASYAKEAMANVSQGNEQAKINAGIAAANAGKQDQYNQDTIGMQIAHQRTQSENIANVADKRIAEQNRESQIQLERDKFNTMSQAYTNGIVERLTRRILNKPTGELTQEDYDNSMSLSRNRMGGSLKKVYATGGPMTGGPIKGAAAVAQAESDAKSFALRRGLLTGAATHTGGVVPKVTLDGKQIPYGTPVLEPTLKYKPIPRDVTSYQTDNGRPYYTDPRTGDMEYFDPSMINLPQFKQHKLGGSLRNRLAGRIRKVY